MMSKIKKYIAQEQAKEDRLSHVDILKPMIAHILKHRWPYLSTKQLPDTVFSVKRMLKNGNILVAEITGGKNTVDSAYETDGYYMHLIINITMLLFLFNQLVTDRMKVADTTKWVTRIYYPIM